MFDTTMQRALELDLAQGMQSVRGDIFTDGEIFNLEMQYIFEGNWVYLAHESQVLERDGYFRTYIGRQPVIITSTRNGKLNAFYTAFGQRSPHLIKLAHFESYRGFLFGSLSAEVVCLSEHLGEAAKIIDLIVDQSPEGLEVLCGAVSCQYECNWKQLQRGSGAASWIQHGGRFWCFENGHLLLSSPRANPPDRRPRSLCLYPNLLLTEHQIRHYCPRAVDQTEVTIYCLAPKSESTAPRIWRIRQYEDFCDVWGRATRGGQGFFGIQHEYWRRAMQRALAAERTV